MPATRVALLRSQVPEGVLAVGGGPLRLSWRITSGVKGATQDAYRIDAARDDRFTDMIATSGDVRLPGQVGVEAPGGSMASREVRYLRVRVLVAGEWTGWSEPLRVEAGLLRADDWTALAITLPDDPGAGRPSPSPLLRRLFNLPAPVASARLYVTSLGLNRLTINGLPVTEDLLAPGWTPYHRRLLADAYDVTALLGQGSNVIGAVLGDGWYRGRLGWNPGEDRARYGSEVALIAQLEVELSDGALMTVRSDETWRASTGEVLSSDLYDGCVIDLRQRKVGWDRPDYDDAGWLPVRCVDYDRRVIEPRTAPPVRVVDVLAVTRRDLRGPVVLEGPQNVAGYVRLRVRGRPGDSVEVRHAEVLEPDGSLHVVSLRSARATDTYILADDGETILEPQFTFHGFQFAEVRTRAEILDAAFVAISSAWRDRSSFECSEPALNRLHENVAWSLRDNFVSLPTDCPQRDERLGWTGDAQVFAATASTMFWSESLWASWLRDLDLEQDDDLGVPSVVPDVVLTGEPRFGRAGWADAATIVPWAVYESYGDPAILRAQFDSMRRWVGAIERRRGDDGLLPAAMQFGDWLDPNAPIERPWEARTDSRYLANAYFAHSARLLARAARLLGDDHAAAHAGALADEVATATWKRWHREAVTTQTGCAVALEFDLVPRDDRPRVAAALARLVADAEGHVATGFLGTPLVLPALAETGHVDEAYLMLLCRTYPSWLYQVEQGATTVWERWDAIRPDGSIHPGDMRTLPESGDGDPTEAHMLSFNHYAYGAVIDWVYRNVAGISPVPEAPGYRRAVFAPLPAAGIDSASATVDTVYGTISIDWRVESGSTFGAVIDIPFGVTGQFRAPVSEGSTVLVDGTRTGPVADLPWGRHTVTVSECRIATPRRTSHAEAPTSARA